MVIRIRYFKTSPLSYLRTDCYFFRFFEVWMKNLTVPVCMTGYLKEKRKKKKKEKKSNFQFLKLIFLLDFLHKFNLIGAIKC